MGRNDRIPTDGGGSLGQNPFGGLTGDSLPAGNPVAQNASPATPGKKRDKGRVDLIREKAGRGGKTVTVLKGFAPDRNPSRDLEALLATLKKCCACGGSLKDRKIELQGDVRERIEPILVDMGYRPVRAGG